MAKEVAISTVPLLAAEVVVEKETVMGGCGLEALALNVKNTSSTLTENAASHVPRSASPVRVSTPPKAVGVPKGGLLTTTRPVGKLGTSLNVRMLHFDWCIVFLNLYARPKRGH